MIQKTEQAMAWQRFIAKRGKHYSRCSLDNFQIECASQREVVTRLKAIEMQAAFDEGQNVILFGPSGTGKDHLLCGLYRKLLIEASIPEFVHQQEVGRMPVRATWYSGADLFAERRDMLEAGKEREFLSVLKLAPLLLLSDPQRPTGALTESQQEFLYDISESRYSHDRPIWLTTNVANKNELAERLGTAVADRLRDRSIALFCNWPSYRKAAD